MARRLTKIYTRTGDDGKTGIARGGRVAKDAELIIAIGDVDELNSVLAVVKYHLIDTHQADTFVKQIEAVQHILFNVGGELSISDAATMLVKAQDVDSLETWIDEMNASLAPLDEFILPGGSLAASHCHVARAVCRRAERHLVSLGHIAQLNPALFSYINRLSDYLFVLARTINAGQGVEEVYWQKPVPNEE